ncbi:MAG: histidine--tRNA ligase [Roseiarcus sp.]
MSDEKALRLVRPALPRGLIDRGPADIAAAEAMIATIRAVYELYGFEAGETPFIEYTEALGKFLPDLDRPNEGVFSFRDDDEQWLSLRYDLTAPLARYVAENYEKLPRPYRSYRAGWVFRNEKPGPGRFRQFMQFDADTVGARSVAADAEMCMMAADCMEALGIMRGDYVIKVNNRKVLDGLMESIGLGGDEVAGRRLTVMRAIDKYDRLGIDGVRMLLGEGRKDESGDFATGAGLSTAAIDRVSNFLRPEVKGWARVAQAGPRPIHDMVLVEAPVSGVGSAFVDNFGRLGHWASFVGARMPGYTGIDELREVVAICEAAGYGSRRIQIDPTVVRGLEYYTGPVFEAELTFETPGEDGRPIRFGSVGGGGRYDGLVSRFRGEAVPATGFSIGVSRLLSALRAIDSPIVAAARKPGPVVVAVLDRDHVADYQRLVAQLRAAGIPSELYLGESGLNAQLKYADRRGAHCAIIQGSNERDAPGGRQVVIRDLVLGGELGKASKDRADYLELRQRAQALAPEAELVARVREVLARHQR